MAHHRTPRARTRRDAGFVAAAVLASGLLGLAISVATGQAEVGQLWPTTRTAVPGDPPLEVAPSTRWPADLPATPPR